MATTSDVLKKLLNCGKEKKTNYKVERNTAEINLLVFKGWRKRKKKQ